VDEPVVEDVKEDEKEEDDDDDDEDDDDEDDDKDDDTPGTPIYLFSSWLLLLLFLLSAYLICVFCFASNYYLFVNMGFLYLDLLLSVLKLLYWV
jgi:hypothetical protein